MLKEDYSQLPQWLKNICDPYKWHQRILTENDCEHCGKVTMTSLRHYKDKTTRWCKKCWIKEGFGEYKSCRSHRWADSFGVHMTMGEFVELVEKLVLCEFTPMPLQGKIYSIKYVDEKKIESSDDIKELGTYIDDCRDESEGNGLVYYLINEKQ